MKVKIYVALFLIILLSFLLRLYHLRSIPNGFFFDEATISYQSYSILQTGKDTWGNFLPLFSFKDYGEHILPIGIYGQLIFIFLGGLNVFWARFPHAVLGIIQIIVIYLLGKELISKKIGLLSAFLLAVQPLSLGWSRFVFEGNFGTVFFLGGATLFVKFLKNGKLLPLSLIFFGLSMISYHIFLVTTPIFLTLALVIYFSQIRAIISKKTLIISVAIIIFFLTWSAGAIFSGAGRQRFSQASTLISPQKIDQLNHQIGYCSKQLSKPVCRAVLNKYYLMAQIYSENYAAHFSPQFLGFDATFLRQNLLPRVGIINGVEVVSLFAGIFFLLKSRGKKILLIPLIVVLIYPFANSFTGVGEISRIAFVSPYFALIGAFGLCRIYKINRLAAMTLASLLLIFIVSFIVAYFTIFPITNAYYTNYGYDRVFSWIKSNGSKFNHIYITRSYSGSVSYISALFFLPVDPNSFSAGAVDRFRDEKSYFITSRIGKLYFYDDLKKLTLGQNDFLIATPEEMPFRTFKPDFTIIDPTGRNLLIGIKSHENSQ